MVHGRGGRRRKGTAACSRERASRLDSAGGEGEDLEAETTAAMASSGAAGGDGTVRRPAQRAGAPLGFPVREKERARAGEKEGSPGRRGAYPLAARGGPVSREQGGGHGGMAAVKPLSPQGRRKGFRGNPLATFSVIPKRSRSNIGKLNEALKHFYKIYKNLQSLPLTGRSFTKNLASK